MNDDIETPDKQMAVVAMATVLPMQDDSPDYPALMFANFVLGQNAKSLLLTALRHEGGLSYGAGSMLQVSSQDKFAALFGYAICAPQNAAEAQTKMNEVLRPVGRGWRQRDPALRGQAGLHAPVRESPRQRRVHRAYARG